ncbi:MAG: hypothetical protein AAFP87_05160 [Pseudomonadota bacterium]
MESADTITARATRLQKGLEAAFGVRAKTLNKALRRTGRRLPRRLHKQAQVIVDAQGLGGSPKLMRQVDSAALNTAETRVLDYLKNIDRADARKGRILGIAGAVAFNLLLVMGLLVGWMWWTGVV